MRHLRRELKSFLDTELPELRDHLETLGISIAHPNDIVIDASGAAGPRKRVAQVALSVESSGFIGRPIKIIVEVSGKDFTPEGSITIYDDDRAVSNSTKELVDGRVTLSLTYRQIGQHLFSARYSGDAHHYDQPVSNSVPLSLTEKRIA